MRKVQLVQSLLAMGALTASLSAQSFAIRNARIIPVSGPVVERGSVVVVDGRIADVGTDVRIPSGLQRIDGRGLSVYPGLFNADTNIGLTEIGAVAVTNDDREMGAYTPHLSAWTAIHVESEHIPVARVDGITHVVTRPRGGAIAGQGAVIHLDGWSQEDIEIERYGALYFQLVNVLSTRSGFERFEQGSYKNNKEELEKELRELKELFARVRHYINADQEGRLPNREMEALAPVVKGEKLAVFPADSHFDIKQAVEFAQGEGLRFAVLGASDAYKIADYLAEKKVDVILGALQSLPPHEDDPNDIIYQTPRILQEKGVRFAVTTGGSSDARTLPFEVGNAVAHGLSAGEALRAITLSPAEIFGVADRLGSIEKGKIANLVVTDGDIFEYQTKIRHVFIEGRDIPLESKHTQLYEKYIARP